MMLKHITLICCLFLFAEMQAVSRHFKQRPPPKEKNNQIFWRNFKYHPPPPPEGKNLTTFKPHYFEQVLDHFTATDTRTWLQRFWYSGEHYKNGGPVFIMIAGECMFEKLSLQLSLSL